MTWEAHSIEVREPWPNVDQSGSNSERSIVSRTHVVGRASKRAVDIVIATTALVLLSPLMLIVALIVKLSDRGPVFYSHTRIGYGGTPFGCLKFRTMRTDAAAQLAELLRTNPSARAEWETTRKLRNDPRITAVGEILRKSSIDELPQLINILRGEMSIVGPRPVTAEELARYGEHVTSYMAARPGLTGQWQISGRNDVSYEYRVALDVQYVRDWSLARDFIIIAKTVPALFSQRGCY
ncbi:MULTISPECIES: sugar transferase [unclassified Rhizobium]|uniref:sugar transferase n=1 Tax=unclassified Rhizobium TaxID=2613769 RepID=UPI00104F3C4F|nr:MULTISPECIES: sugar transferase [unclassified Rhizobium]TCS04362.1 exopolysaccharide production protein ExoY [Rhizobium sp. BK418]